MQQSVYPARLVSTIFRPLRCGARRLRLIALLLAAGVPAAHAACEVTSRASIPLTPLGRIMTVPVEVNGASAVFVLDTGSERSVVSEAAVSRLGLARDPWVDSSMRGIGGVVRRPNAKPRSLSLGGIPLVRQTLSHDTSLVVTPLLRDHAAGKSIDGLLGRDYLSTFDLDIDLPGRRLTLYAVHDCQDRFLPWRSSYGAVPFTTAPKNAVVVPVQLDGRTLRAMLDSGATSSLLFATGMFRMGLDLARLAGDPADTVAGLGPRAVVMHQHVFASLRVGERELQAPAIWVAPPFQLMPSVDMLLGMDWLSSRRIWISFATRRLFVADP